MVWKINLEKMTILVLSGMAPVTHSTRAKRKTNFQDLSSAADQHLKTSCCSDLEMRWTVSTEPLEKSPSERLSLLIPTNFTNVAVSKPANERAETDDLLTMPTYEPHEDIFFFSGPCSIQYAGI